MNQKLSEALDHISDRHIAQAAKKKKRLKKRYFLGAVAAILAAVIFLDQPRINQPRISFAIRAQAVSLPGEYAQPLRPDRDDYEDYDEYRQAADQWMHQRDVDGYTAYHARSVLRPFFADGSREFLTSLEDNALWSPANAWLALAMLAETTGGTTRQQILALLGDQELEEVREQTKLLWEAVYADDGNEVCVLANSLWIDDSLRYDQAAMDTLAGNYYASVYQGDLESRGVSRDMQTWLNNQTGGFLRELTGGVDLSGPSGDVESVLAIASTIFFQSRWGEEFNAGKNTTDVFHAPSGDRQVTYMNKKEAQMTYYWGESYGAVCLGLSNNSAMWLILPDEDKTVADVLAGDEYMAMLTRTDDPDVENSKYMKVNLSVPKFDVNASLDLRRGLEALGVTEVFSQNADFTMGFVDTGDPIFVTDAEQASRVKIDEQGVTAASYIVLEFAAGSAAPPEEVIDFVVDRPFLFAITGSYDLPLFVGVVNEP